MAYDLLAQGMGFVAMALCTLCYQFKSSRGITLCKMFGDIAYGVHYLLLGAYSGCLTMAVSALSGLLCSMRGQIRLMDWKGWKWVFVSLMVAVNLAVWRHSFDPIPCVCALASMTSVVLTYWSGGERQIRLNKLFAGPTWIIYSLSVRSYPGVINEVIGICSAISALIRYKRKECRDAGTTS